jgi:hypothetical protein
VRHDAYSAMPLFVMGLLLSAGIGLLLVPRARARVRPLGRRLTRMPTVWSAGPGVPQWDRPLERGTYSQTEREIPHETLL